MLTTWERVSLVATRQVAHTSDDFTFTCYEQNIPCVDNKTVSSSHTLTWSVMSNLPRTCHCLVQWDSMMLTWGRIKVRHQTKFRITNTTKGFAVLCNVAKSPEWTMMFLPHWHCRMIPELMDPWWEGKDHRMLSLQSFKYPVQEITNCFWFCMNMRRYPTDSRTRASSLSCQSVL